MRVSQFLVGVFLFVVTASAYCTKQDVIDCMYRFVDTNNDTQITKGELDQFIMENTCGVKADFLNGETIIDFCDYNRDGVLTAAEDINGEMMPCLYSGPLRNMVCRECDTCSSNTPPA